MHEYFYPCLIITLSKIRCNGYFLSCYNYKNRSFVVRPIFVIVMNFYIIEILVLILSFLFFFIITTFIKDGFRLSNDYLIRKIEIYLFYLALALILIFIMLSTTLVVHAAGPENIDPSSVINSTDTNSANIGLSGTVVIDANGAKVLAEAGKQIGSHIGLACVVGALTGSTASVLKSAAIPPMQKAGIIAASGVAGAAIHTGASLLNKKLSVNINTQYSASTGININEGPSSTPSSFSFNSPLEEPALVEIYNASSSDNTLEMVLYCIYVLNILNLFLLFLLTLSLVSK